MYFLRTCGLAAAAVAVLLAAPPAKAELYTVPKVGTQVGSGFALACPDDEYLVGIDYTVSPELYLRDMVGVCEDRSEDRHRTAKHASTVPEAGLGLTLRCGTLQFVRGLQVGLRTIDGQQRVWGFHLICGNRGGGPLRIKQMNSYDAQGGTVLKCRGGDTVNTLIGNADDRHINAIGLYCDKVVKPITPESAKVENAPTVTPQPDLGTAAVQQPCSFCQEQVFADPKVNGTAVDVCLNWGTNCGKPAADAFCQGQGFAMSSAHAAQGNAPPTLVLGDGTVCNESFCARLSSITCTR
jgi:hypothetical protein